MADILAGHENISDSMTIFQMCEDHLSQKLRLFGHDLSAVDRNPALEVGFWRHLKRCYFLRIWLYH
jgi:hypothetical protein